MRKAPPGGNGKGSGVSKNSTDPYNTPADPSQTHLIVWPADDAWAHIRSLPSTDRQDVVDLWWELRLQGVRLHPQAHVIVLPGWRR